MFRTIETLTVRAGDLPDVEREIRGTGRGIPILKIDGKWREVFDVITDDNYEAMAEEYGYSADKIKRPFDNSNEGLIVAVRYLIDEKSDPSGIEDGIAVLRTADLVQVQWPTEPNGQPPAKYEQVHQETRMLVTFNGEAWEFMYALLKDMTEKNYCVTINGRDVALQRVEGDVFETEAVLIVKPWVEAEGDYVGAEEGIRLFEDDGQCAITQFHVI